MVFQCKQRSQRCLDLASVNTLLIQTFSLSFFALLSDPRAGQGQFSATQPKIQFSVSKRGGQLLWLDGLKFFRNNENRTNFFWRCHWYYRHSRCPVLICMNKFDSNDFRQIHEHCHIKSDRNVSKQAGAAGGAAGSRTATKRRSSVPNALDMFSI